MILCADCFVQRNGKTLMLHRNKKENDINAGKWIGLGGKFEYGESPEDCIVREVREEAGITLTKFTLRGLMTFVTVDGSSEPLYIFVFTASAFEGKVVADCNEGTLKWVDSDKIDELELWEGDHLLWEWLQDDEVGFFSAHFTYDGDRLVEHRVTFY